MQALNFIKIRYSYNNNWICISPIYILKFDTKIRYKDLPRQIDFFHSFEIKYSLKIQILLQSQMITMQNEDIFLVTISKIRHNQTQHRVIGNRKLLADPNVFIISETSWIIREVSIRRDIENRWRIREYTSSIAKESLLDWKSLSWLKMPLFFRHCSPIWMAQERGGAVKVLAD